MFRFDSLRLKEVSNIAGFVVASERACCQMTEIDPTASAV
jgi:hypothetical protein